MVVSGGLKNAASGRSSKPTTLMSSGTRMPCSAKPRSSPTAIRSFPTNTAVRSGCLANCSPAAYPERAVQSAGAQGAVQHLLRLGHATVWHVAGPADSLYGRSRTEGWRSALDQAAAATPALVSGDWTADAAD